MYQANSGKQTQDVQDAVSPPEWTDEQIRRKVFFLTHNENAYVALTTLESLETEMNDAELLEWAKRTRDFVFEYAGQRLDQEWFDSHRKIK